MNKKIGLVKVAVDLVDGSYDEWNEPLSILAKHDRLVHDGLRGKALVHALLHDDWGPPPVRITLSCPGVDGKLIEIAIPYS